MARTTKAQRREQKEREQIERERRAARTRTIRGVAIGGGALVVVVIALMLLWPAPLEGDTSADAWDLPALEGDGRVAIADFRGTPTVAAFFASWCEVCEHEIPEFLDVSREVEGEVQFVGIDTQDGGNGLSDAERWGIAGAWPLARDIGGVNGSGLSTGTFGMRGSPMTAFYDADGTVVHIQRGGISGSQLRAAIRELFDV